MSGRRSLAASPKIRSDGFLLVNNSIRHWQRRNHRTVFANQPIQRTWWGMLLPLLVLLFALALVATLIFHGLSKISLPENPRQKKPPAPLQTSDPVDMLKQLDDTRQANSGWPEGWTATLWQECWLTKSKLVDFTSRAWRKLPLARQLQYSRAYQVWYADQQNLPVEKIINSKNEKITVAMRLIPPGIFWMGSSTDEPGHYHDEKPAPGDDYHRILVEPL